MYDKLDMYNKMDSIELIKCLQKKVLTKKQDYYKINTRLKQQKYK